MQMRVCQRVFCESELHADAFRGSTDHGEFNLSRCRNISWNFSSILRNRDRDRAQPNSTMIGHWEFEDHVLIQDKPKLVSLPFTYLHYATAWIFHGQIRYCACRRVESDRAVKIIFPLIHFMIDIVLHCINNVKWRIVSNVHIFCVHIHIIL